MSISEVGSKLKKRPNVKISFPERSGSKDVRKTARQKGIKASTSKSGVTGSRKGRPIEDVIANLAKRKKAISLFNNQMSFPRSPDAAKPRPPTRTSEFLRFR